MQEKLVHFTHFHFFQTSSGDMQAIRLEPHTKVIFIKNKYTSHFSHILLKYFCEQNSRFQPKLSTIKKGTMMYLFPRP